MSEKSIIPTRETLLWLIIGIIFFFLLSWLQAVLVPFIAALVLAYLLAPLVAKLEKRKIPRWAGTSIVLLGFILIFTGIIYTTVPLLKAQASALSENLPRYINQLRAQIEPMLLQLQTAIGNESGLQEKIQNAAQEKAGDIAKIAGNFVSTIIGSTFRVLGTLPILFLTPVIAFYLLRDWPTMLRSVHDILPRAHRPVIMEQVKEIDATIAGFIRGQTLVCLCLAAFYGIALTIAGLELGLVIGILSGVLSFIPYVGSIFGGIASIGLATAQFGVDSWERIAIIAGIYLFGQFIEGNVLSPKLVGERVNLHPVWIIFALFAGGALYGFMGVLIAVPVAAALGVLIRFAIARYKNSFLY